MRKNRSSTPFFLRSRHPSPYLSKFFFKRKPLLFILSLLFIMTPITVLSADFTVNPVRVFFQPGKTTGTVTVKNDSEETLTLQLSVFSWDQDLEGNDIYAPTEE